MCASFLPSVKMSTLSACEPGSSAQSPLAFTRLLPPTHWPLEHESTWLQALPSSHGGTAGCSPVVQPRLELELANTQTFGGCWQTTALPPLHVPAPSHVSPLVQASASSHLVPEVAN